MSPIHGIEKSAKADSEKLPDISGTKITYAGGVECQVDRHGAPGGSEPTVAAGAEPRSVATAASARAQQAEILPQYKLDGASRLGDHPRAGHSTATASRPVGQTFFENLTGANCHLSGQTIVALRVSEDVDADYDTASVVCIAPGGPYGKGSVVDHDRGRRSTGLWEVEDPVISIDRERRPGAAGKGAPHYAHVPAGLLQAAPARLHGGPGPRSQSRWSGADNYPPKFCTRGRLQPLSRRQLASGRYRPHHRRLRDAASSARPGIPVSWRGVHRRDDRRLGRDSPTTSGPALPPAPTSTSRWTSRPSPPSARWLPGRGPRSCSIAPACFRSSTGRRPSVEEGRSPTCGR